MQIIFIGDDRKNINNIDPDINHYCNNVVDFGQYSTDSFIRDIQNDQNSLNIFHNNTRSNMSDGRLEKYEEYH